MESEHLKFSAKLAISTAGDDGVFNVASTCAYGNTLDPAKIKDTWEEKEKGLKEKYEKEEIANMKADWLLLDAKRLYIDDSFDFILETVGIYSNFKLMNLASAMLIQKLYTFLDALKSNAKLITEPADTMENCYVVAIENEDYTIGKIMEYYLYNTLFVEKKELNFVGFLKKHPHDINSFIKMSYKIPISKDEIIVTMEEAVNHSALLLKSIKDYFDNE
jgi:DNA-directed RNA polymerase subunit L